MGRFYKTAKPEFVEDIIFQPPWELAKEVIQGKDKAVDTAIESQDALELLTKDVQALKDDEGASNDYINSVRKKADEVASAMQGDLLNAGKYNVQIRNLTKELQRDLNSGLTGKTKENFAARAEDDKRLDELVQKDPSLAGRVDAIKKRRDTEYSEKGGLNYKSQEEYNKFITNATSPAAKFDESSFLTSLTTHFNKNQSAYASSGPDSKGYIWTKAGTTEGVDGDRVREYMRNTPEMVKWKADAGQEIELKGFNELNKRGTELDSYVKENLKVLEDNFIEAAAGRAGYEIKKKNAQVTVDQKVLTDINNAARANPEGMVKVEVVTDRRDTDKVQNDSELLDKISQTAIANGFPNLDGTNQVTLLKQIAEAKRKGKLGQLIKDARLNTTVAALNNLLEHTNEVGVRTNLVDIQENKEYTPADKVLYGSTVKAIENAVTNFDKAMDYEVAISSNTSKDSRVLNKTSVLEMFNMGMVAAAENLGGVTKSGTVQEPNPQLQMQDEEEVYVDVKKNVIKFADGTSPKNKEEAIKAAKETGVAVKMDPKVTYTNVLGNNIAIVNSTVHRFKSSNGLVDNYEIELTTVSPGPEGNQITERAIVKIPATHIKTQVIK